MRGNSRIFAGCINGNPSSFARTATAGECSCIPRPDGLSDCATTQTISCARASASSVGTAKSGVPRKRMRNAARFYVCVGGDWSLSFGGGAGTGFTGLVVCPSAPLLGSGFGPGRPFAAGVCFTDLGGCVIAGGSF